MKTIIKSFIIAGIIYMIIGVLLGGFMSGGSLAEYIETDEGHWVEVIHIFIDNIGFLSFIIMGLVYFVVPQISKKEIYSKKIARHSLILVNVGLITVLFSLLINGLGYTIPSLIILIGGVILTIGFLAFGYNVLKSL